MTLSSFDNMPKYMQIMAKSALKEATRLAKIDDDTVQFEKYQTDPIGFCKNVLNVNFTEDVERMCNSVRDNTLTIARSANGVGKTHAAARLAIWFYKCFPESQVYTTAAPPFENLKKLMWGELLGTLQKNKEVFSVDNTKSMLITRSAQEFIAGVAIPMSGLAEEREAKFSGKHAPHLLFIVDEGDAVPDEVYRGIESCMSGGHARMLVTFNPKMQFGPVYQKEYTKQASVIHLSAFRHPNVLTGENVIPGAVTREVTLRRINEWTRPRIDDEKIEHGGTFEVPDFLIGETCFSTSGIQYPSLPPGERVITEPAFSYMVMGEYPAQSEAALVSNVWIENAQQRWHDYVAKYGEKPPDNPLIMSVDVAELGTDPNVMCRRYSGFVSRFESWNGIDTDMTATKTLEFARIYNPKIIYVDATGVGSSVAPSVARQGRDDNIRTVGIKTTSKPTFGATSEYGEFYQLRDQLWWTMREWLRLDPTATLPPDPYLVQELKAPTYTVPNGKIRITTKEILRDRLKRSPDRADSLVLTFMPVPVPTIMLATE
jgi:hypothetical protein